jgi:hypothetical protein
MAHALLQACGSTNEQKRKIPIFMEHSNTTTKVTNQKYLYNLIPFHILNFNTFKATLYEQLFFSSF